MSGSKKLSEVSTGFGVSAGAIKLVGGGNSFLGGADVKGYATSESGFRWWVSTLGTGVSGRVFSTVDTRVT